MKELNSKLRLGKQGLITAKDLNSRINEESLFLLDIREREDYDQMKIDGAIHSEWEAVVDLIEEDALPKDRIIVVICYNGQSSMQISTVLNIQGYHALSLLDGMDGWRLEEFKVISNND